MYLPPTIPHGATSGSYYIPPAGGAHPAVVVDQAGKPTVVGTSMQMPMQYQIASAGLKVCSSTCLVLFKIMTFTSLFYWIRITHLISSIE